MTMRTRLLAILLVALVVSTGCNGGSAGGGPTVTPVATRVQPTSPTYVVERGDALRTVPFTGRISPVIEERLYFLTAGYVAVVHVQRDDAVEEGDVLAELEVTDLKNQLAQAEASLLAAQQGSEQRIAEAEANLSIAELRLSITRANNPDVDVLVAEVNLERAQTGLADAQKAYQEAVDRVWEPDTVREAAADRLRGAELSLAVAEAQYQRAQNTRLIYYYNIQIEEQQVELARLRLQEVESGLDVTEIELLVQRLQGQLDEARLIAPFDGVVRTVATSPGRSIEAYQAALIVAQLDLLEVSAELNPQEMQELTEGMEVTCAPFNEPGDEIPGHIRRLPGAEDEDRTTRVTLDVAGSDLELEANALMRVVAVVEYAEDVICLPREAILTFQGRRFVVVRGEDGDRNVDIKIGVEGDDCFEIQEGLSEGEIVVGR